MTNQQFQAFLTDFFYSPQGQALLKEEQAIIDRTLSQVFGLYLVQLGRICEEDLLVNSRVTNKVLVDDCLPSVANKCFIQADIDYLPIKADSIDVFVLPHTLESVIDPYHLLRQVDQMLIPEGHLLITGFNPLGCRTISNRLQNTQGGFKQAHLIRVHRLVDWLSLLGYDIELITYSSASCFSQKPAGRWLQSIEQGLGRAGLHFGNLYAILAKKRIFSPTPVGLNWRLKNWLTVSKGQRPVATSRSHKQARQALKDKN